MNKSVKDYLKRQLELKKKHFAKIKSQYRRDLKRMSNENWASAYCMDTQHHFERDHNYTQDIIEFLNKILGRKSK